MNELLAIAIVCCVISSIAFVVSWWTYWAFRRSATAVLRLRIDELETDIICLKNDFKELYAQIDLLKARILVISEWDPNK